MEKCCFHNSVALESSTRQWCSQWYAWPATWASPFTSLCNQLPRMMPFCWKLYCGLGSVGTFSYIYILYYVQRGYLKHINGFVLMLIQFLWRGYHWNIEHTNIFLDMITLSWRSLSPESQMSDLLHGVWDSHCLPGLLSQTGLCATIVLGSSEASLGDSDSHLLDTVGNLLTRYI